MREDTETSFCGTEKRVSSRKTQSLPVIAFFFVFCVFCFIAFVPCFLKFGAFHWRRCAHRGELLVYVCYNTDIYASREYAVEKFIIDSGLLSEADISRAEKEAKAKGHTLKEVLLATSGISEDEMRRVEAYTLGIPFVNLKDQKIGPDVLSLIPEPIARKHNVVAFQKTKSSLEVAMLDTEDLSAIDFIKKNKS